MRVQPGTAAAPGAATFALHTLGWRAFQDLCAAVLREVWGQAVHTFADSRDQGRDGAFHGIWHQTPHGAGVQDLPDGPFVLQCKHTKKADTTLSPSSLEEEFGKAARLVRQGQCHNYVLLTNARVSGASDATIRRRLREAGVRQPLVLDGQWICHTIATHQRLRTFVPRIYGLGDLSQILDERAYAQAQALLGYLRDDLATFVVTSAYRRAAEAVSEHGFVLLLGEPAVGKSVIAATLGMTALDAWGCRSANVHDAEGLTRHWNPYEPDQFFWIDDAFGAVRHEQQLTDSWSRHMRKVMAAVHGGAKVVLTSRDYIYRDARPYLKEYAYPLLHEQQVVVDVARLSGHERRQILYNHISLGDQPAEVRSRMKPYLEKAADQEPFHPEVARRLGRRAFTGRLQLTEQGVTAFMARPTAFLRDIYSELGPDERAALALTYQAGDHLPAPLALTGAQQEVVTLLGGTAAGVSRALSALTGTFLRLSAPPGQDPTLGWSFRHPTLQEGFAELMAHDPNLLGVFIGELPLPGLLTRLDCGTEGQRGTLVRVPPALYPAVARRLHHLQPAPPFDWPSRVQWSSFFTNRCSDAFLAQYLRVDPAFGSRLTRIYSYLDRAPEPRVLARLHQAGLLPGQDRDAVLRELRELAVDSPDAAWLREPAWEVLLTAAEREELLRHLKDTLVHSLPDIVSGWDVDSSVSPEDAYDALQAELATYREAFEDDPDTVAAFDAALKDISEAITTLEEDPERRYREGWEGPGTSSWSGPGSGGRSIFDDIDS